jgi:beta-N-acetylhexosaminidase
MHFYRFVPTQFVSLLVAFCLALEPAMAANREPNRVPAEPSVVANKSLLQNDAAQTAFIENQLSRLTLRQKVGQLFVFGFMGEDTDYGLGETIRKLQPGGIIVFGRNIKSARQLAALNFSAQRISKQMTELPLLIAVDQEGGDVIRIHTSPPLPSALALGQTQSAELAQQAGYHTGVLLKTLGFTMDLAPVMDVSDPKQYSFIGTRTFGKDPNVVALMGGSFASGLQRAGILPTAKHFPGHGGVRGDSHQMTPEREVSLNEMLKQDLLPFAALAKEKEPPAMMIAHVGFPKLDPTGLPATFSKTIVTDILRKRLGFNGVAITDDLEMEGAAAVEDIGERALMALDAGVDLLMFGWNKKLQARAVEAVLEAAQSGRLTESRIDESLRRILHAKYRIIHQAPLQFPSDSLLLSVLRNSDLKRVSELTLADRFKTSITEIDREFLEAAPSHPVYVFSALNSFFQSFHSERPKQNLKFFHLGAQAFDINKIMRANPQAFGVFYLSGPTAAELANQIQPDVAHRILLVNTETQSVLRSPDSFRHIIDVAFHHPDCGKMTAYYFFDPKYSAIARKEQ